MSYSPEEVEIAGQYLRELSESLDTSKTVLTTHRRALFTDFKHDTLIFDEDPINSLLDIKEMEITDLYELYLRSGKERTQSYLRISEIFNRVRD